MNRRIYGVKGSKSGLVESETYLSRGGGVVVVGTGSRWGEIFYRYRYLDQLQGLG